MLQETRGSISNITRRLDVAENQEKGHLLEFMEDFDGHFRACLEGRDPREEIVAHGKDFHSWYLMLHGRLLDAAEKGDANSQAVLGYMYSAGGDIPKDVKASVMWYGKAAEQGHRVAQHKLGGLYYRGKGVEKDYTIAVMWYTKAAEQGYAGAQYQLGLMYDNGIGVPEKDKTPVMQYTKAAEQVSGMDPAPERRRRSSLELS